MKFLSLLLMSLLIAVSAASGVDFQSVTAGEKHYTVCRVNLDNDRLQLFLNDEDGKPLKSFPAVEHMLALQNQKLVFAMNAGMYKMDFSPVGLFVNGGREISPLNLQQDEGNFFLRPNGVFFVN